MDVWLDMNWFAVNTKPHREGIAAMNIGRLGLDVLLPRISCTRQILGSPKAKNAPMFPCYLFARFSPRDYLHPIRYARGVRKVVSAGDVPIPIDSSIINSIRSRMDGLGCVDLASRRFDAGEEVIIQEGFLQGLSGVFERELSGHKRVVILLQSIEYQARVLVEKRFLSASIPETV
jgi:transcriptional antiterminator RfaH